MRRPHHHRPWPFFVAVIQVVAGLVAPVPWTAIPLLIAGPLLLASARPRLAVAGVCAWTLTFIGLGYPLGPVAPSTAVAVIVAVRHGERLAAWLSLGGLTAGWYLLGLFELRPLRGFWQELIWAGLALLAAGVAELIDNRRQRIAAYRELYIQQRRQREEQERLRVARELHDVLAHSLSLIAVRASVALELIDTHPDEVRSALLAIKQASKGGLEEVRTVLSGLRDPAPRSPAPSLDRLDELVDSMPGLSVTLTRTGAADALPLAVSLAAYRVIQEALTNVIRHSKAGSATVHVHQARHVLLIGVHDAGPASSPTREPGAGLIGIAERASTLGGVAEAGPSPDGGFTVHVGLPL